VVLAEEAVGHGNPPENTKGLVSAFQGYSLFLVGKTQLGIHE
jgi:hypothetical protein